MKTLVAGIAGLGLALLMGLPAPAAAHEWHYRGHDGPWHHRAWWHHDDWRPGPRIGLHLGFGAPFVYREYRDPPPVVIYRPAPPPAVYAPPSRLATTAPPVHATPTSPVYTDSLGRSCREYQTTVTVAGVKQPAYGTACLEPDGSWHIVK